MTFFRQIKFQLLIPNRCVLTMNVTLSVSQRIKITSVTSVIYLGSFNSNIIHSAFWIYIRSRNGSMALQNNRLVVQFSRTLSLSFALSYLRVCIYLSTRSHECLHALIIE